MTGCFLWTGHIDPAGYARFRVGKESAYAHRYVFEAMHGTIPAGAEIDHSCGLRCCVNPDHLRACTSRENKWNMRPRPGSSSRFKGVSWCKFKKRWRATIRLGDKHQHLGYFDDEAEAARTYDQAATKTHGHFAYTNTKAGLLR
jgi:hypothetical protein